MSKEEIAEQAKAAFKTMCEIEEQIEDLLGYHVKIAKRHVREEDGERRPHLYRARKSSVSRPRILAVSGVLDAEALRPLIDAREAAAAEFRDLRAQLSNADLIEIDDDQRDDKVVVNGERITAPLRLICADGIHLLTPETLDAAVASFNESPPLRSVSYRRHEAQSSLVVRTQAHRDRVKRAMNNRVVAWRGIERREQSIHDGIMSFKETRSLNRLKENMMAQEVYESLLSAYNTAIAYRIEEHPEEVVKSQDEYLEFLIDDFLEKSKEALYSAQILAAYFECYPEIDAVLPDGFTFRIDSGHAFYIRVNYARKGQEFRLGTVDVIKTGGSMPDWKVNKSKPSRALLSHVYSSILLPHAAADPVAARVAEIVAKHKPAPS